MTNKTPMPFLYWRPASPGAAPPRQSTQVVAESMQTCGVHCDAVQNGVLEVAFRPRYSGFHPANGDEATVAIVQ